MSGEAPTGNALEQFLKDDVPPGTWAALTYPGAAPDPSLLGELEKHGWQVVTMLAGTQKREGGRIAVVLIYCRKMAAMSRLVGPSGLPVGLSRH